MGKHGRDSTLAQVAGSCECGDGPSGSIKCREFLDTEDLFASQKELRFLEFVRSLVG